MRSAVFLWVAIGVAVLGFGGLGGWLLSLPSTSAITAQPPIAEQEQAATLAALKPPKRARPLVAIVGINDATETTDYLMPYGILRRAEVADVMALATKAGPVTLFPALTVQPDATTAEFDARHPDGADYVIVPAMSRDDDPEALAWIRNQAERGATIVSICAGAKVTAATGLLDGHRATTHWYSVSEMLKRHPAINYVPDRRLVVDTGVATTTGITASMPMMLTLIEAIAGRAKAEAVASDLGLAAWDARHDSAAFKLTRPFATQVLANTLQLWNHEQLGIELTPGMDEVSLALVADAWSRTYRSRAVTVAASVEPIETLSGLRIVRDQDIGAWPRDALLPTPTARPAEALDQTLDAIAQRYDMATSDVVAMQLEYLREQAP